MTIRNFNNLSIQQQKEELFKCCGSTLWVEKLLRKIPFASVAELKNESDIIWLGCDENDWLEAFTYHPKIGDLKSLEQKFASTEHWASSEQEGVNETTTIVLLELKELNDEYEKKFGYIFIVCATGKSAEEMLQLLKERLQNNPDKEIKIAMQEQNKITHIRIDKLFA
ncbi:MAG: 2-oxo-4-hydroxy-4-carboxy-5-ureidoimidazoline decarboxylase [Bacteroidia bacterium]